MKKRDFKKENCSFAYFLSQQKARIKERPAFTLGYRRLLGYKDAGYTSGFQSDRENLDLIQRGMTDGKNHPA